VNFSKKIQSDLPAGCRQHVVLAAAILLVVVATGRAQQIPTGHATDFVSSTYHEPPNERQVKVRLSGAEAAPLPGGLLDVKQLRLETFSETGKPEIIVTAPRCVFDPVDNFASSSGHLVLQSADGQVRMDGDGFLWRQADNSLTISNNVHTVIKAGSWKLNFP
jgi:hypothetical protein